MIYSRASVVICFRGCSFRAPLRWPLSLRRSASAGAKGGSWYLGQHHTPETGPAVGGVAGQPGGFPPPSPHILSELSPRRYPHGASDDSTLEFAIGCGLASKLCQFVSQLAHIFAFEVVCPYHASVCCQFRNSPCVSCKSRSRSCCCCCRICCCCRCVRLGLWLNAPRVTCIC